MTPTFATDCPRCGAAAGKPCTRPNLSPSNPYPIVILPTPHPERTPITQPPTIEGSTP